MGKSTVAAATALAAADAGARTLVLSVDSAHNLADILGVPLGPGPTPVDGGLFGLEVDVNRELAASWGEVLAFAREIAAHNPRVDSLVAEECAVLPGMEEALALMRLQSLVESGDWDVLVVDSPPTGDLLKLLRLPDVLDWLVQRFLPLDQRALRHVRPLAEALQWPLPEEGVLRQMEAWHARALRIGATLLDPAVASVRLVFTPDRVALAETRRALTWTSLLGLNVDGVIVNRVLPPGEYPPLLGGWRGRQEEVLAEAETAFGDLPLLRAELRPGEVLGVPALREFGRALFEGREPAGLWRAEPPLQWREAERELWLRLPFLRRGSFRLFEGVGGLVLHAAGQRRLLPLPAAVRRRRMQGATYADGWLRVRFGPPGEEPPAAPAFDPSPGRRL